MEQLPECASPEELDSARAALKDLLGEVSIVEKGGHVYAYTVISGYAGYNSGAEERT